MTKRAPSDLIITDIGMTFLFTDGSFQIRGYDLGVAPQPAWNSDDYEFTWTVPPEGARRMLAEFVRERFESHHTVG